MRVPYTGKPAPSKFQVEKLGSCRKLRLGPPSFCVAVTLGELLNPTSGVDKLLLTSEERVAGRADTNLDVLLRRTGLVGSTTGAGDHRIVVLWVNFIFHGRRVRLKIYVFVSEYIPSAELCRAEGRENYASTLGRSSGKTTCSINSPALAHFPQKFHLSKGEIRQKLPI